jgi:kynurenine formamidase
MSNILPFDLQGLQIIDLSVSLDESLPIYPTDPRFEVHRHATIEKDGVNVSLLAMGLHSGTHVDAPSHFMAGAPTVDMVPLSSFYGPAVCIDCPKDPGGNIDPEDVARGMIQTGDIVLFRTGWEKRAGTPRFFQDEWPGFTEEAIEALVTCGAKAIGGDICSADSPRGTKSGARGHKAAARHGLPIFEALINLREVVGRRFLFFGLPIRLSGCEAGPVRAVALLA